MPVADEVTVTVLDDDGDTGTFVIDLPPSYTLAQLNQWSPIAATIIDAILSGKVIGMSIRKIADISGLTANTILSYADVEETSAWAFLTTEGRKVFLNIPGVDESVQVAANTDNLDLTYAANAAVESMMLDGLATGGGTIIPCDEFEDDLASTLSAREGWKKSGRRR